MNSGLTIAIVTKGRPLKLARCLDSVCNQTLVPEEVLIVDNDVKRSAYRVYKKYIKKLPLRYIIERRNVPAARNKALEISKTRYLGFVDDDCILDANWVKFAINKLKSSKRLVYACGKTNPYSNYNILAIAQHTRDSYWYLKKLRRGNQTLPEHFDTKNVILDRNLVLAKNLKFDSKCSIGPFDSADFDFGLQLTQHSLRGIYLDKMQLMHEETSSFQRYIQRAFFRGKIASYINNKWGLGNKLVDLSEDNILIWLLKTAKRFPTDFIRFTNNLRIPILYKILVVFAIRAYEGAYLKGYISYKET